MTSTQQITPWANDPDGGATRTVTGIAASPPPKQAVRSARKPKPVAARNAPGKREAAVLAPTTMVSVRLTDAQIAAIDTWREQYPGLSLIAAVRVLISFGLTARPVAVTDPLVAARAQFARSPT